MFFLGGKKEFVFETQRDSFLNAQVINAGIKEGNESTISRGMKLMKRRLCFRITAKLGNSKGQHCTQQEKKKCIYIEGSTVQKSPRRKRKKRSRKDKKVFYSHMNHRNASYVQGDKC